MWESASNHHYCSNPIAIISTSRQLRLVIEARHRQDGVQLARDETEWEGEGVNRRQDSGGTRDTHLRN